MSGEGVFDYDAIRQSCWQTCDNDPGAFPMDLGKVPVYRDQNTRAAFYNITTFFGCVENCEDTYVVKRVTIIAPAVALALLLLGLLLLCWFCKGCFCYRWRKSREKVRQLSSSSTSSTLDFPSSSLSASTNSPRKSIRANDDSYINTSNNNKKDSKSRKYSKEEGSFTSQWSGRGSIFGSGGNRNRSQKNRKLLEHPPTDMNASLRSNVSVNSWVNENKGSRRSMFLATATKLGRKLADLDKRSEDIIEKRNQQRRPQRTNSEGRNEGNDDDRNSRASKDSVRSQRSRRSRSLHKDGNQSKQGSGSSRRSKGSGTTSRLEQPKMRF
ncbi:hypothetical protein TCAL_10472 [Tigriopus californicus]|uniref:Uncharacterized protein n=1 Tax=Tigriopus californicus TaxID=6832 RepID=A0A553NQC6_TIGCA|nr:hypothetical protein TCAL_10472 [Tigriopus californicus]|eukprot:TCALIF_10472-PA protein Name:"Protein of unknown function" AED:0.00 eAED:0.00 QI:116/1/1/1/1/1/2/64/325